MMDENHARRPDDSMAIAGFFVSLLGLFSCPLISPIGMVMSLKGLRSDRTELAMAGVVIGAIGTLLTVFLIVVFVFWILTVAVGIQSIPDGAT
ncbi:MAG: hypothetical protein CMJ32_00890 [Phycisphaerae bacterium]|nr:hypothetical protein [Phycisphaerae bacterium]